MQILTQNGMERENTANESNLLAIIASLVNQLPGKRVVLTDMDAGVDGDLFITVNPTNRTVEVTIINCDAAFDGETLQ